MFRISACKQQRHSNRCCLLHQHNLMGVKVAEVGSRGGSLVSSAITRLTIVEGLKGFLGRFWLRTLFSAILGLCLLPMIRVQSCFPPLHHSHFLPLPPSCLSYSPTPVSSSPTLSLICLKASKRFQASCANILLHFWVTNFHVWVPDLLESTSPHNWQPHQTLLRVRGTHINPQVYQCLSHVGRFHSQSY